MNLFSCLRLSIMNRKISYQYCIDSFSAVIRALRFQILKLQTHELYERVYACTCRQGYYSKYEARIDKHTHI